MKLHFHLYRKYSEWHADITDTETGDTQKEFPLGFQVWYKAKYMEKVLRQQMSAYLSDDTIDESAVTIEERDNF